MGCHSQSLCIPDIVVAQVLGVMSGWECKDGAREWRRCPRVETTGTHLQTPTHLALRFSSQVPRK